MLTGLYQALCERLAPLQLPLFEPGCVPQGQTFPYMTLAEEIPAAAGLSGSLTLTLWCCGARAHADRLTLADQALALLPGDGLRLETAAARLLLLPGDGARCLRSAEALGLQLHWTLKCFPIG